MIEGANLRSVHNELIRDRRFVLIGRGIYALREWGYFPGEVKDIIFKFLKEEGPLTKEEILERIKKQRMVKENTVLINLAKYFERDEKGRYRIKTAEI
jgi:DNA-directed RNA polymerase delta subunit